MIKFRRPVGQICVIYAFIFVITVISLCQNKSLTNEINLKSVCGLEDKVCIMIKDVLQPIPHLKKYKIKIDHEIKVPH